jgi:hypothetical protein
MICKKEHRYLPNLSDLPESQGGEGRHMCAGCAYEQGYDDATSGKGRHLRVEELDESQAGTGRHRDVESAYHDGYSSGLKRKQGGLN